MEPVIPGLDDNIVAKIVSETRDIMNGYPTLTKITACYNLMMGMLNVCSIGVPEKELIKFVKDFNKHLLDHTKSLYQ